MIDNLKITILISLLIIINIDNECRTSASEVICETKLGKIKGSLSVSRQSKPFIAFKGIPYANVVKRFQPAELIFNLNSTLFEATKFGAACPQINIADYDENCLFLNVYVHKSNLTGKPVIIFLHGGNLKFGSGNFEDPTYFMDEDVILVTINYRLNAFGFLTTPDNEKTVPNLGLKDTVLALKWVQNNIESFGGNKNKVTVMGQSAGALVASFLIFSPTSNGLFQSVILHSSSIVNPRGWRSKDKNDQIAFQLNDILGCDSTNNTDEVTKCLMSKTTHEIINATKNIPSVIQNNLAPFWPIIEKEGPGAFIWENPLDLLKEGRFSRVPVIITITRAEGLLWLLDIVTNKKRLQEFDSDWADFSPGPLVLTMEPDSKFNNLQIDAQKNLTNSIRSFYFGSYRFVYSPTFDNETLSGFKNLFSDRYINYGAEKMAIALSKYVPVYAGIFTRPGEKSIINTRGVSGNYGVAHGDDLQFFFSNFNHGPFPLTNELTKYSELLIKTWMSFVTNGLPTIEMKDGLKTEEVKWPNVKMNDIMKDDKIWLDLGKAPLEIKMINKPFGDRLKFWDNYYERVVLRTGPAPGAGAGAESQLTPALRFLIGSCFLFQLLLQIINFGS